MRARGFTLLEIMLAALIGAMVVTASIGVFNVLGDTDRRMGARYSHSIELARLHLIMQRAARTLLIAPDPTPSAADNNTRAGDAAAALTESDLPPRLLLETDSSATAAEMSRQTAQASGLDGFGITSPQRLEIVLTDPPLPANFVETLDPTITQVAARPALRLWEQSQPTETAAPTGTQAVAVRGVFELRPDWATRRIPAPGQQETEPAPPINGDAGWTLWWRPLPAEGTLIDAAQDPRLIDPTRDANAVPIASGLTHFQWRAFKDRERTSTLTVTHAEDMPAFLELEVRTTSGITANWMFEVGMMYGPETVTVTPLGPDGEPTDAADGDDNAGAAGAEGAPGAPRRPGDRRRGNGADRPRPGDRSQPGGYPRGRDGAPGGGNAPRPLGGGGPR